VNELLGNTICRLVIRRVINIIYGWVEQENVCGLNITGHDLEVLSMKAI